MVDERDTEILKALMKNARISYVELSKRLKITEAAIRKRVKKLEAKGVIKGFFTAIDPSAIGLESISIIGVDTKPDSLMSTMEFIKGMKNVRYLALSSGDHMIMFEVWCKDQHELSQAISKLKNFDGVTKVCPAVLLKSREFVS